MRILLSKPQVAPIPFVAHGTTIFLPQGTNIQYFEVPRGVYFLTAKIWSGGGGLGSSVGPGGSAFIKGDISVVPREILTIYVGLRGANSVGQWNAGAGGGASAILRGSTVLAVAGAGGGGAFNVGTNNVHGRGEAPPHLEMSPNGGHGAIQSPCLPYVRHGGFGFGVGGSAGHNCGHGLTAGAGGGAGYVGGAGGGGTSRGYGGYSFTGSMINKTVIANTGAAGSTDPDYDSNYGSGAKDGRIVLVY